MENTEIKYTVDLKLRLSNRNIAVPGNLSATEEQERINQALAEMDFGDLKNITSEVVFCMDDRAARERVMAVRVFSRMEMMASGATKLEAQLKAIRDVCSLNFGAEESVSAIEVMNIEQLLIP